VKRNDFVKAFLAGLRRFDRAPSDSSLDIRRASTTWLMPSTASAASNVTNRNWSHTHSNRHVRAFARYKITPYPRGEKANKMNE
jgi:hypothetical protein